ncbi:unnamed protein product, partial [Pneumocystis jirovecii]
MDQEKKEDNDKIVAFLSKKEDKYDEKQVNISSDMFIREDTALDGGSSRIPDDALLTIATSCGDDIVSTSDDLDYTDGSDWDDTCRTTCAPCFELKYVVCNFFIAKRIRPYKHQVGGHHTLFRFSKRTVCKPLAKRENEFYEAVEHLHRDLLEFMPKYMGVLNVTYKDNMHMVSLDKNAFQIHSTKDLEHPQSDKGDAVSLPKASYEKNRHAFSPVYPIVAYVEGKEGCQMQFPSWGTTTIHQDLEEQILGEPRTKSMTKHRIIRQRTQLLRRNSEYPQGRNQSDPLAINAFDRTNIPSLGFPHRHSYISKRRHSAENVHDNKKSEDFEDYTFDHRLRSGKILTLNNDEDKKENDQKMSPHYSPSNDIFSMDDLNESLPKNDPLKSANSSHESRENISSYMEAGINWSQRCFELERAKRLKELQSQQTISITSMSGDSVDNLQEDSTRVERFILIEDLASGMKRPCVLDLKMGTRQYGVDASEKKRASQTKKCAMTTSRELGVRICGMQVWNRKTNAYLFQDKYHGRNLKAEVDFQATLTRFLHDGRTEEEGGGVFYDKIPIILNKLVQLEKIIRTLKGYRFYASSLLLLYDGGYYESDEEYFANVKKESSFDIDIKIIDFANCIIQENNFSDDTKYPPKHPNSCDYGYIRGLRTLRTYLQKIWEEAPNKYFIQQSYKNEFSHWNIEHTEKDLEKRKSITDES